MTIFHSLTVARVEPETADAVAITFAVPEALQEAYRFRPGQHLTLKAQIAGGELRRCYSICRAPAPGELSVAVKAIEGGRFSRYAVSTLRSGMELEVMVPQGLFGYQPDAQTRGRYLALAAGSGITPLLAIISATLATEAHSEFTLIYGNRSSQSMMFRQALADLKDQYPTRLQLIYLFSQEAMDSPLFCGRIDAAHLSGLSHQLVDFSGFDKAFLCGPQAMMDASRQALCALGLPAARIFSEHFNTPDSLAAHCEAARRPAGKTVTLRQDGRERQITLNAGDNSILDAALRQGADLPYACKGGVCATCKCKVLRGEVSMAVNYSLEADQLAAGFILSCQSLPKGDDLLLDFDAQGVR